MKPSVCCIGGITTDRTLLLQEPAVMGTSNPASSHEGRGGVARNVAENLARLSLRCQLISVVGDDMAGQVVVGETSKQGVDVSLVDVRNDARTGAYCAVMQEDGELLIGLADMDICECIDQRFIDRCWHNIAEAQLVFADTNIPAESLQHLLVRCRADQKPLFVDAVSVVKAEKLPAQLHGVEMLFCNLDEAAVIVGDSNGDAEATVMALTRRGARTAVVTAGADGLWCASTDDCEYLEAVKTDVVDVNGAGDAVIAGALLGRLSGQDQITSCKMGLAAAAMTIGSMGRHCPELSAATILNQAGLVE